MLDIIAEPVKTKQRRIVPSCLEQRAPAEFGIFDEAGNPVPLTLVGYKVQAGYCYTLRVAMPNVDDDDFKLLSLIPRSVAEVVGDTKNSFAERNAQCFKFEPAEQMKGLAKFFHFSRAANLEIRLVFKDGRDSFELLIPIVIKKSIWLNLLPLFLPSIYDVIKQIASPSETFAWSSIALMLGVGVLLTCALGALDQVLLYRKACSTFSAFVGAAVAEPASPALSENIANDDIRKLGGGR